MKLLRRLIELAFIFFIISIFMKNKDAAVQVTYFGFSEPLTVAFWELVTLCVSLGIIIAAVGDFITQLKWVAERRRLTNAETEQKKIVENLTEKVRELEAENARLKRSAVEPFEEQGAGRHEQEPVSPFEDESSRRDLDSP